ncbi:MAG: heme biosynthesis HemY N-terminal domain-containing protein [Cellvibrionaceae bacterium]
MIRGFLFFCAFLTLGAFLYQFILQDAGYLLIVLGETSIETSLWFALLSLIIIVFLLWCLLSFFRGGLRGLTAAKQKVFGFGDEKAQSRTVDGLIDFIEGDWPSARKKLTRSAGKVKAPIINYLAAARSAYEMGEEQNALELLHKAENSTDKGGLAVAITQARMQLANQQFEQALATLERASAIRPEHPVVLSLRQQVYIELKDWTALKALLPQLVKNNICSSSEVHQLEKKLNQEKLLELIEKNKQSTDKEKTSTLKTIWNEVPTNLQEDLNLLSSYGSQLMALGEHDEVEKRLSSALSKTWHGQWVDLYGLLICSDPKKPLKTAEKWLTKQPKSANLLLALGRLCIQNQQWGRSVDFFQQSLALQKRPETYAELARVLDYIGETEKSIEYYKKGLLISTHTLANDRVFK